MTRDEYLDWIRTVSTQLAVNKYPDNPKLQAIYQLGLLQRAIADLCYIDSDNAHLVNRMLKRNMTRGYKTYTTKRRL